MADVVPVVPMPVPPPVVPGVDVPVEGVVVAGVVVAGVDVTPPAPVVPVLAVEPVEAFVPEELVLPPVSSALLVVTGVIWGVVAGTSSATVVPPQAAIATATSAQPASASERLPRGIASRSERTHATPAGRAVVEVALGELFAPRTEAKMLHGPRQLRARGRERQDPADHLQRLARLTVGVDAVGVGLHDHLTARGGGAQAVAVTLAHRPQMLPTTAPAPRPRIEFAPRWRNEFRRGDS